METLILIIVLLYAMGIAATFAIVENVDEIEEYSLITKIMSSIVFPAFWAICFVYYWASQ